MTNLNHAEQITRDGEFELPCAADTAYPLFSPEGEKHWVPGWSAKPVFPVNKMPLETETVFMTDEPHGPAMWMIAAADKRTRRTEYVAFEPKTHCGHITVRVEVIAAERCRVHARYTITAFGEHKKEFMQAFNQEAFGERMLRWKEWIEKYLQLEIERLARKRKPRSQWRGFLPEVLSVM